MRGARSEATGNWDGDGARRSFWLPADRRRPSSVTRWATPVAGAYTRHLHPQGEKGIERTASRPRGFLREGGEGGGAPDFGSRDRGFSVCVSTLAGRAFWIRKAVSTFREGPVRALRRRCFPGAPARRLCWRLRRCCGPGQAGDGQQPSSLDPAGTPPRRSVPLIRILTPTRSLASRPPPAWGRGEYGGPRWAGDILRSKNATWLSSLHFPYRNAGMEGETAP